MKETEKHKLAFELYYAMGSGRSLAKLREKMKEIPEFANKIPSLVSLKKWSKNFNWQERIEQRLVEAKKDLEKKTNETILDIKAKYSANIRKLFNISIQAINNLLAKKVPLEIENIKDFREITTIIKELINTDLFLIGESEDKYQLKIIIPKELIPEDMENKESGDRSQSSG